MHIQCGGQHRAVAQQVLAVTFTIPPAPPVTIAGECKHKEARHSQASWSLCAAPGTVLLYHTTVATDTSSFSALHLLNNILNKPLAWVIIL